jgi:hypothetical protein
MSFGSVALIDPPARRSFRPRVMHPPIGRGIGSTRMLPRETLGPQGVLADTVAAVGPTVQQYLTEEIGAK